MAITTLTDFEEAMVASNKQFILLSKAQAPSSTSGFYSSTWRSAAGIQAQGAIPTTAAVCNNTTTGGILWNNPLSGNKTYVAEALVTTSAAASNLSHNYEIHDRLAHMGGLNGTLTTAQTVGIDLNTMGSTDNITARKGISNYSEVQWWVEVYTVAGSLTATLTVNFVDQFGSNQSTSVTFPSSSLTAGKMYPIWPSSVNTYIRGITSVQLSTTTGSAGDLGIVATRRLFELYMQRPNTNNVHDWTYCLERIEDSACMFPINYVNSAGPPGILGTLLLVQG